MAGIVVPKEGHAAFRCPLIQPLGFAAQHVRVIAPQPDNAGRATFAAAQCNIEAVDGQELGQGCIHKGNSVS